MKWSFSKKSRTSRRKKSSKIKRSYSSRWRNTSKRRVLSSHKRLSRKKRIRKIVLTIVVIGLLGLLAGIVVVSAVVSKYSREIPPPGTPFESGVSPQTTYIYDRDGTKELYKIYGDKNAEWCELENIPTHVRAAFLSAEDASFYSHKGLDLPGIGKAVLHEAFGVGTPRGASTITQQLIQNTVGSREHSYERKLKELILSMQIEQKYTKDEILEAYLNHLPFGGNIYGISTASKAYFGKEPKDLTVAEAAMLAGFPQKPTYYAPPPRGINPTLTIEDAQSVVGYPKNTQEFIDRYVTEEEMEKQKINDPREYQLNANEWRQLFVLDQMADKHNILRDEGCNCAVEWEIIDEAKAEKVKFTKFREEKYAGHFVDYVRNELEEMFEEEGGSAYVEQAGLKVYTTLDWELQQIAEEEIKQVREDETMSQYGAYNGAVINTDPKTGEILVMVGSRDYWGEDEVCDSEGKCKFNGQTNVITSLRSPGSSIKPLMYTSYFEQGYAPTTFLPDISFSFGNYEPKNYDRGYWGFMDTRYALEWSRNIPAVSALSAIGVENFTDTVGRMGYTQETLDRIHVGGLSSTIGGASITMLEHAQAYSTLANGGIRHDLTAIQRIEDRDGNVVYEHDPEESAVRVVDEKYTYLTTDIIKNYWTLEAVRDGGYAGRVAGKTGTNDGPRDIVFAGYTQDLVSIMWAGNNDNSELRGDATGSKLAKYVWNDYALRVLPKFDNEPFQQPSGIVQASVCRDTGYRPGDSGCSTKTGLFAEGQLPPEDDLHQKVRVAPCPKELKLASEADEIAGVAKDKTYVLYKHPSAMLQSQLDRYLETHEGYGFPPEETCDMYRQGKILVEFTKPNNNTRYNIGDTMKAAVSVGTPQGIAEVKFFIDNNLVKTATQAPYSLTYSIDNSMSGGRHVLKAVAKDTSGKTGEKSINFIVDKNLPSGTVSADENLFKPTGDITIVVENPGLADGLEVWVKNTADGTESKISEIGSVSSTNVVTWDISGIEDDSEYQIWAVLTSGPDRVTSNTITVAIKSEPPEDEVEI